MPDGNSPMIAPTTLVVAETLNAVKMYGAAVGNRSFHKVIQRDAAYECMSSSARGSAERRPRSVLMVIGKNARYAAIMATDHQPARSQTTTIGAMARIGTVWDAT